MGFLTFPVLLLLVFTPHSSERALSDFGRFEKAVNTEIAIVDMDGTVREGILRSVSASELTMEFGASQRIFQRDAIASGERLRDGRLDGTIKGAIFGLLIGVLTSQAYDSGRDAAPVFLGSVAVYAGLGYAFDAAQTHRQPIYRGAPTPAAKIALRF
jgi:hypothetical protein